MIKKMSIGILMMIFLAVNVYAELNPSAVYCDAMGYKYIINTTPTGSQVGICVLPDGSSVGAWDFLKGKLGKEHSYCEKEGYRLKTISDSPKCFRIYSQECAVCVKDGEEIEVTKLMNLSFDETVCGDGVCTAVEDFLTCPEDCPSGRRNGYCDGLNDGACDPDCAPGEDPNCPDEDESRRFETPKCIDDDGVCHSECIDKDSDCETMNASGFGYGNASPESGMHPEPEIEIECVYDGICYEECIGKDDIDCICYNPKSEECKKALGVITSAALQPSEPAAEEKQAEEVKEKVEEKEQSYKTIIITAIMVIVLLILIAVYVYKEAHTVKKYDLLRLKEYISVSLDRGFTRSQIRTELIKDGWDPKIVKKGLSEVKEPKHLTRMQLLELQNYVMNSMEKGYTKKQIINELIRDGWTKKQIEEAYKKS